MYGRFVLLLAFALPASTWSNACVIPGLRHEVTFADGSATLSGSDVRSLTHWYVGLRDGPLGIDRISVSAYSIKGDDQSAALMKARVNAVTELVGTLGNGAPIPLTPSVVAIDRPGAEQFPELLIAVQPKCAMTQSCCSANPNLR